MNNYSCKPNLPKKETKCIPELGITIVIIPAQSGDSEGIFAPKIGDYKNTLVKYLADSKVFMYDKDGNYTFIGASNIEGVTVDSELSLGSVNPVQNRVVTKAINDTNDSIAATNSDLATETRNREDADSAIRTAVDAEVQNRIDGDNAVRDALGDEITNRTNADNDLSDDITAEATARANAITGVENKIDTSILGDLVMTADANNVSLVENKINLNTGSTTSETDTIPAASATTAGTISAAEYQTLKSSEQLLEAINEGSVAIPNISATPSQQDLTNAWLQVTGQPTLINRASIYDVDNDLIWTYYLNSGTWYSVTAGGINIDPFTNSVSGVILGSTDDGKVSANQDGTGSVSGWATVKGDITNLQTNKADASSLSPVATSGSYTDLSNKPTIPTITMQTTDPGEGATLAANHFIAVYQ